MYFTKTRKFILAVLVAIVSFAFVGVFYTQKVHALSTSDTVTYPFATEDYALANAPTLTGISASQPGAWQFAEQIFDNTTDLSSATYVGVEFENVSGNPGVTIGIMSQGERFGIYTDGQPVYFVNEEGTVTQLSVLYSSVNFGENAKGMILLPLSSLSLVGWAPNQQATLAAATSFFIEANGEFNYNFSFKIGEVCYYSGDPTTSSAKKLLDLSTEIKKAKTSNGLYTATFPEKATDTTKSPYEFVYPFATGDAALANAPTLTGISAAQVGGWQFAEQIFDNTTDLSSATYVGVEFENVSGNPGVTIGIMSQGERFGIYTDGQPVYFVNEEGTVTQLSVLYSSVNFGENAKGMILLPLSSLSLVGWAPNQQATLAAATSFFIEANGEFNYNFSFKMGEICYYTEDPLKGATGTEILDLTNGIKKAKTTANLYTLTFPGSSSVDSIAGMNAVYPFAKGEQAFENAMVWVGTTVGDTADNNQTFKIAFDSATDLTGASYLAIHYYAKVGTPGITYGIENGNTRHSIIGSSGEDVYMLKEDGSIVVASTITWDAVNNGLSGCLLIPMKLINKQYGDVENAMASAKQLVLTTNSKYNWNFEIGVGEVGYYTGQPCDEDFTFHKLVDLSAGDKKDSCTVTSDLESNRSTMYCNKSEQLVWGDTTLVYTATGKTAGSMIPWEGGANGEQSMTEDSYGDDALQLVCTGTREGADAYCAFTIGDGLTIDWSNAKGVTLWARNDGDKEISFNFEMDVTSTHTSIRARFNITQGNRFWLYDINTGKQTIYMTRPCITLPAGFEGWVRVPFEAFNQAQWSIDGAGAFPREYFMTEGSNVPYICITIYSGDYTNHPFAINKIGGYTTTPSFISALVPASDARKDIASLMGLN